MPKVVWALIAVITLVGVSLWILDRELKARSHVRVTKSQIDNEIRGQLPLGTPRAVIETFLDKRAIAHHYFEDSANAAEDSRTEYGMIRNASAIGLIRTDLQLRFKFDSQSRLTGYSVQELYTGP